MHITNLATSTQKTKISLISCLNPIACSSANCVSEVEIEPDNKGVCYVAD